MSIQEFQLNFEGYWRAVNVSGIPNEPGIYCVYICTNNSDQNTIQIHKLIHIGQSDYVQNRLYTHEKLSHWLAQLDQDQELCFNFAKIAPYNNEENRKNVKSALGYYYNLPYDSHQLSINSTVEFQIETSGSNALLENHVIVQYDMKMEVTG